MAVVHSNESWEDYVQHWPRLKRELLNVIELGKRRQRQTADVPGANYFPVPFRNDSGEAIPAYAVMRVTGSATVKGIPTITVAKPSTTFQRIYLVNGPLVVPSSSSHEPAFGTWLNEAGYVLYDDSNTPAYGEGWGPSASSWKIKKYRYGFTILDGATGGDTDIVAARQAEVCQVIGKPNSSIAQAASAAFSIYDGNQADTGDDLSSVTNRTEITAESATWATATFMANTWFCEPWECP